MSCWAVVVAAGRGSRAGLGVNKVFYTVGGRSVLGRCLDAIKRSGCFDGAVVVLSQDDEARFTELQRLEGPFDIVKYTAPGGESRRDSVCNGLLALPRDTGLVAIHDAARPFVSKEIIKATLDSARACGSGVISTPVVDTIKHVGADGRVTQGSNPSTLAGHGITDAYTKQEIDSRLTSGMHYRGSVPTQADLPASGNVAGDFWNAVDTGNNYAWDGTEWDYVGNLIDFVPITNEAIDDVTEH